MSTITARRNTNQRIVPGEFWYAYGSSAIDLSLFDSYSDNNHSHLRICCNTGESTINTTSCHMDNSASSNDARESSSDCPLGSDVFRTASAGLMIIALIIFGVVSAFSMIADTYGNSAAVISKDEIETEVVAVSPGDTLWGIASMHPIAGMTTQECIRWIMEENEMSDSMLAIGQIIVVPSCQ